jgi:hypothetical protein
MIQKTSYRYAILILILGLVATALAITNVVQPLRQVIREKILGTDRNVLGKTEGDLSGKGDYYLIAKVHSTDTLSLEIYRVKSIGSSNNKDLAFEGRMILPEKRDAYLNFHGRQTNLALTDIDNDGTLEILAPTFDENLIPRLNVYKFDIPTSTFIKLSSDQIHI